MSKPEIVVAGHICFDFIPTLRQHQSNIQELLTPGSLLEVDSAVTAVGGVANTGIALDRLGTPCRLICKIGDDLIGKAVSDLLNRQNKDLTQSLMTTSELQTSYSVVISPPNTERMFLHHAGANDSFSADDINEESLSGARIFHFGYPPGIRSVYSDGGKTAQAIFAKAKNQGALTSVDMCMPDPNADSGKVNWKQWLATVLPTTDIFLPSWDEILFMLDTKEYESYQTAQSINEDLLQNVSGTLLEMGCAVVVLKLGEYGMYLRTTSDNKRIAASGSHLQSDQWLGREIFAPGFRTDLVGTNGAGDCAIAGFLAATLKNHNPENCLIISNAVGAANTEQPDATSGVPDWSNITKRLDSGWENLSQSPNLNINQWHLQDGCYLGPNDAKNSK